MSLITIFITPKGFDRDHVALIQRNAIRSWKALGDDVDILLIGDDPGVEENAEALGVRFIKEVKRNSSGTPMLDDIFRLALFAAVSLHEASKLMPCRSFLCSPYVFPEPFVLRITLKEMPVQCKRELHEARIRLSPAEIEVCKGILD